jgi:DNA-binding ferritin-like protein
MSSSSQKSPSKKSTEKVEKGPPSVHAFLRVILQLESDVRMSHWYNKSYASHKATNALYSELAEKADEFVERALGRNRAVNVGKSFDIKVRVPTKSQLVSELKKAVAFLESDLPKSLNSRAHNLLTTRDDLIGSVRRALYRLSLE